MNIYYDKIINIDVIYMFKEILKGIAPCILIAGGVSTSIHMIWKGVSIIKLISEGAFFVLIYGLVLFKLGMNQSEKEEIQQIIRRLR